MIILASNSETRAEILKKEGIEFKQMPSSFDEESIQTKDPKSFVFTAVKGKLESFLSTYDGDLPVLCADTIVESSGKILRKAKNENEARDMLYLQSGRKISILTCMALKSKKITLVDISATFYDFDIYDEKKLEEFLKSGDWKGKAGACMVEGFCKNHIKRVEGYKSTAKGLCVEKLIPFLELS